MKATLILENIFTIVRCLEEGRETHNASASSPHGWTGSIPPERGHRSLLPTPGPEDSRTTRPVGLGPRGDGGTFTMRDRPHRQRSRPAGLDPGNPFLWSIRCGGLRRSPICDRGFTQTGRISIPPACVPGPAYAFGPCPCYRGLRIRCDHPKPPSRKRPFADHIRQRWRSL